MAAVSPPTSNGLASGNHLLEAISHGICEVVERDSTALWNTLDDEAARSTRIDLSTVDDPSCIEVLEKYERAGVAVGVWDITSDVGLPSFACTITDASPDPLRPLSSNSGHGCHPARQIALLRALTEAAQSRLTFISGSRDDAFRNRYEHSRNLDVLRRCRAELDVQGPMRNFKHITTQENETLDQDVAWELERLGSTAVRQVVVVNLTKPEFGLPVVRVVIPGLEGSDHSPHYSPGPRAEALMESRR